MLKHLGDSEVTLKHDQESALKKVTNDAKAHRGPNTQTTVEHGPVKDSQPIKLVECKNRTVEGQVRAMVSPLEEKLGKDKCQ